MKITLARKKNGLGSRIVAVFLVTAFTLNSVLTPAYAQVVMLMPAPGSMVKATSTFTPPVIKGLEINLQNPLQFDFLIDQGETMLPDDIKKEEYTKLIKYFLAALTLPEQDMWVNLSPYEHDRIIPDNFGQTEMGRDLLSQDYILKQLTASLIYPEEELGQKFWDRVQKRALELYGTVDVPLNTFNKVWIVPDQVIVYEKDQTAWILTSHLKVMLEQDYKAMINNLNKDILGTDRLAQDQVQELTAAASQVVREVVIPEIEKEVNEGRNFALLRQIYQSMILATWYKRALKDSLLAKVYADKNKLLGVNLDDPAVNQRIYEQYLEAFKKGVYNYIKEEYDPTTEELIPRKYFSGGFSPEIDKAMRVVKNKDEIDALPGSTKESISRDLTNMTADVRLEKVTGFFGEAKPDGTVEEPAVIQQLAVTANQAANTEAGRNARSLLREAMVQRWSRMLGLPEEEVAEQLRRYDQQYEELEMKYKGLTEFSTRYKALIRQTMEYFRVLFAQVYGLNLNNVAFVFTGSMGKGTVRVESADIDMDIVVMDSLSREELKVSPEEWSRLTAPDVKALIKTKIAEIDQNMPKFLQFMSEFFGKTVSNEVGMYMKSDTGLVETILESDLQVTAGKSVNLEEPAPENGNMFKRFLWRDVISSGEVPELFTMMNNIMTAKRNKPAMLLRISSDLRTKSDLPKQEAKVDSRYYRIKEGLGLFESFIEYVMVKYDIMLANKTPGDEEDYGTIAYALRKAADKLVELGVITQASELTRSYDNLFTQIHQPSAEPFSLVDSPDVQNVIAIMNRLGEKEGAPITDYGRRTPREPVAAAQPEKDAPVIRAAQEIFKELASFVKQEIAAAAGYAPATTETTTDGKTVLTMLDNNNEPMVEVTNISLEGQGMVEVKTSEVNSGMVERGLANAVLKLDIKTAFTREKVTGALDTAFRLPIYSPVDRAMEATAEQALAEWGKSGIDLNAELMNQQIKDRVRAAIVTFEVALRENATPLERQSMNRFTYTKLLQAGAEEAVSVLNSMTDELNNGRRILARIDAINQVPETERAKPVGLGGTPVVTKADEVAAARAEIAKTMTVSRQLPVGGIEANAYVDQLDALKSDKTRPWKTNAFVGYVDRNTGNGYRAAFAKIAELVKAKVASDTSAGITTDVVMAAVATDTNFAYGAIERLTTLQQLVTAMPELAQVINEETLSILIEVSPRADTLTQNVTVLETAMDELVAVAQTATKREIRGGVTAAKIAEVIKHTEAQKAAWVKGGIDLNAELMNLQIKRDKTGVPLPMDLQNIGDINVKGFIPVIINIIPVTNSVPILSEIMKDTAPAT